MICLIEQLNKKWHTIKKIIKIKIDHLNCTYLWTLWIKYKLLYSYANEITKGDELLVPQNYEVIPTKVNSVIDFVMQGNNIN